MAGIIIVGTGPGIATSVARRFGAAGMPVGLIARSPLSLATAKATLALSGVDDVVLAVGDAADDEQLTDALDGVMRIHGTPEVLVYNAGWIRTDRPGELDQIEHVYAYAVNVLGALTATTRVAPRMVPGSTVIITGGMPTPLATQSSLSLGKAGVRALTAILAQEYRPAGIHVATVTVGGTVAPGGAYDPDDIADAYWALHQQGPDEWEHEVLFRGAADVRDSTPALTAG